MLAHHNRAHPPRTVFFLPPASLPAPLTLPDSRRPLSRAKVPINPEARRQLIIKSISAKQRPLPSNRQTQITHVAHAWSNQRRSFRGAFPASLSSAFRCRGTTAPQINLLVNYPGHWDKLTMMQQIGAIPALATKTAAG
jgi:hypothetical protein